MKLKIVILDEDFNYIIIRYNYYYLSYYYIYYKSLLNTFITRLYRA